MGRLLLVTPVQVEAEPTLLVVLQVQIVLVVLVAMGNPTVTTTLQRHALAVAAAGAVSPLLRLLAVQAAAVLAGLIQQLPPMEQRTQAAAVVVPDT